MRRQRAWDLVHMRDPGHLMEQMLVGARCDGGNVRGPSGHFHVLISTSVEGHRGLEV